MVTNNITLSGARILFRNFSGNANQFNAKGNRNFCVIIEDPELVRALERDGWNIRYLQPREEGDEPQAYLQVKVQFPKEGSKARPPKIVLVTSGGNTILDEETVSMLDYAEISNVDMILRPYNWEVQGKSGVKAYLKSIYVTIVEDELEKKYAAMESSALSGITKGVENDGSLPF